MRATVLSIAALVVLVGVAVTLLRSEKSEPADEVGGRLPLTLTLSSPAFANGEPIPAKHTCDGLHISPEIRWAGLPRGTRSLALITTDYDAPTPSFPLLNIVHWLVFNLPPDLPELEEGVAKVRQLAHGAWQGNKTFGAIGYWGPCPPWGTHRYRFRLYALDTMLPWSDATEISKKVVLERMDGHILALGELVGTYRRK